jgi:hypothetical protein
VFLGHHSCKRDSRNIKSLFQSWGVVAANLENLGLVRANMNTVPHVPLETCEGHRVTVLGRYISGTELSYFISVDFIKLDWSGLFIFSLLLTIVFNFKSSLHREEVNFSV